MSRNKSKEPLSKTLGCVKWFSKSKNYGFIKVAGRTQDIFVHYSSIQIPGHKSLEEGQMVLFRLGRNHEGKPIALDVLPVKAAV